MELDQQTEALIEGIAESTGQDKNTVVKEAVESQAEELGKQLIAQQGAQKLQQEQINTEDLEPDGEQE
jgi:predicted DNA-binding protein